MFHLRYWYKKLTAIRVYNFAQLKSAIENIGSRPWYKTRTIYAVNQIVVDESIIIPANIDFVFDRTAIVSKGKTMTFNNPDQIDKGE